MTFERTFDYSLVSVVMAHPRIWPQITDDFAPERESFEVPANDAVWYVTGRDNWELLGVWAFVPQNAICWEVHTCVLPTAWGKRALQACQELAQWIFEHTPCVRIVTNVPSKNRLALRLAKGAGFTEYGVNEKSYMKGGQLQDQILLGLSKGK